MKYVKKIIIIVLCILCLVFGTKILWNVLIDAGYIPFTEEYDRRFYLKQYKKCEKEFQALKKEIELYVEQLPQYTNEEYDEIHFSNKRMDWRIYVSRNQECIFEHKKKIDEIASVEHIEKCFKEILLDILYEKETNTFSFLIGEYYRIIISEEGVTVE